MVDSIGIALLAAGKGTRMKFDGPKVLVPLLGRPLIDYVLDATADFSQKVQVSSHTGVVIGHEKEKVQAHIQEAYSKRTDISFAVQEQQKGTADALKSYFQGTSKAWDKDLTLVVCGDTPLLTSEIFCDLYERLKANSELQGVAATFTAAKPTGYGRIQREDVGFKIIEQKDANEEQKLIKEVNSGLYLLKTEFIKKNLEGIDNDNNSGEFYLTDLFQPHFQVQAIEFEDAKCFQGVNNLTQLQQAEETLRKKKIKIFRG
jgi:bifunctional UDP-N-acetylglucosamine pyrophosphorylase/glucosamine-1-phosphate N-acetyltransferase